MAYGRGNRGSLQEVKRVRMDGTSSAGRTDLQDDLERLKKRREGNTFSAYDKYKSELHAFFDGDKPLPDHLRDLLATRPGAEDHGIELSEEAQQEAAAKARKDAKKKSKRAGPSKTNRKRRIVAGAVSDYDERLADIRKATSPREVESAINAFRERGHTLPEDAEILSKALGHSDDAVLLDALRGLLALVDAGKEKSPKLLKTRLDNVALLTASAEVREMCGEVLEVLKI